MEATTAIGKPWQTMTPEQINHLMDKGFLQLGTAKVQMHKGSVEYIEQFNMITRFENIECMTSNSNGHIFLYDGLSSSHRSKETYVDSSGIIAYDEDDYIYIISPEVKLKTTFDAYDSLMRAVMANDVSFDAKPYLDKYNEICNASRERKDKHGEFIVVDFSKEFAGLCIVRNEVTRDMSIPGFRIWDSLFAAEEWVNGNLDRGFIVPLSVHN